MYMPLCRGCHARESNLNKQNQYEGDPAQIDVKLENEAQKMKATKLKSKTFSSDENSTTEDTTLMSNGQESPALKSFQSDIEASPIEDEANDHF